MSYLPNKHDPMMPMVFEYKWYVRKKIFNIQTVIYDYSLEDMLLTDEDAHKITEFCENLFSNASGIILMLDPMNIPGLVQKINDPHKTIVNGFSGGVTEYDGAAYDIITRVSKMIRSHKRFSENKKIDIPVAAVFSKYDSFDSLVAEGSTVKSPSPHCELGKFDDNDRQAVNSEIAYLIDLWGERYITSQLENNFNTYSYFAVSALGLNNTLDEMYRFNTSCPHRVEDPILWLMKENRIIK